MTFGKFKNRPIDAVPDDYLVRVSAALESEVFKMRQEIARRQQLPTAVEPSV